MILKFRAWHKKEKKMYYVNADETNANYLEIGKHWYILNWVTKERLVFHKDGILMQSTGLKDNNGKEIFEGDIIKKPNFKNLKGKTVVPDKFIVAYEDGGYYAKRVNSEGFFHITLCVEDFEVIGNIYENPKLLEESIT